MRRTYDGAVAIVTGGASGIGLAIARELIARGAVSVTLADVREEATSAAASTLGPRARGAALDVRSLAAFRALVDATVVREGRLDFLFANAGVGLYAAVERHAPEDWARLFEVNLGGVVNAIQAAYPQMIAQGSGHLVTTASFLGRMPAPMVAGYVASKHAIVGLTRALRVEAAVHGVRASVLCPGVVRTAFLDAGVRAHTPIEPARIAAWRAGVKPVEPEEVARVALDGVARNREIIVAPRSLAFGLWLCRVFPALEHRLLARDLARTRKLLPELFTPTRSAS